MTSLPQTASDPSVLLLRGRAYGLCAKVFTPTTGEPPGSETLAELRDLLARLGDGASADRLAALEHTSGGMLAEAADEYVRLFVKAEASPYEASHEAAAAPGAGGRGVFQIADVAGFYRAFGFHVQGDRPDHLSAELEFAALLCVKEAYASLTGEADAAEVCREARARFLADHLLAWLPAFCEAVGKATAQGLYPGVAASALALAERDRAELSPA